MKKFSLLIILSFFVFTDCASTNNAYEPILGKWFYQVSSNKYDFYFYFDFINETDFNLYAKICFNDSIYKNFSDMNISKDLFEEGFFELSGLRPGKESLIGTGSFTLETATKIITIKEFVLLNDFINRNCDVDFLDKKLTYRSAKDTLSFDRTTLHRAETPSRIKEEASKSSEKISRSVIEG